MALAFCILLFLVYACNVTSHGLANEQQKPIKEDTEADWETRHMAEEHSISGFDRASFFSLHDYDNNGVWDIHEILKTYGMDDPSAKNVSEIKKNEVTETVLRLFDVNANNVIEKSEFLAIQDPMPDFGLGPGHHWGVETEFDIHHFQKYHDENTKMEDLIHQEDIQHFNDHEFNEEEAEKQVRMEKLPIVESNIPTKFKKSKLALM